jgi:hypothetical protein
MDRDYYASLRERLKTSVFNLHLMTSGPLKGRFLALRAMEKENARIALCRFLISTSFRPLRGSIDLAN